MCRMSAHHQNQKTVSVRFWLRVFFRRRWRTCPTPSQTHHLAQSTNLSYHYPPPAINRKTQTRKLLQRPTHWTIKAITQTSSNEQQNQSVDAIRCEISWIFASPKINLKHQKVNLLKHPKFHEFQCTTQSNQWTQWLKQH